MSREERVALLDLDRESMTTCVEGLSVRAQTQLLRLNRSSLYYQRVPPSPEELWLKRRIDEIYTAHPFYGSRRIAVQLCREGHAVNCAGRGMRSTVQGGACGQPQDGGPSYEGDGALWDSTWPRHEQERHEQER